MSLPAATQPASATGISITVDMTDWDLERIEVFLNLIGFPIIK
jgi:hypothetical protein